MNKERILQLADHIEKQLHTAFEDKKGFNMSTFTHMCGTPSCIAGYAAAFNLGFNDENQQVISDVEINASHWLALDSEIAIQLFFPIEHAHVDDWCKITPKHAATVLRNLAETGIVNWNINI